MFIAWENFHLIEGRDFEDLKKRAAKRFAGKDIRIVHWGFRSLGTPFAIVEAVMSRQKKTPAEPQAVDVSEGLMES